ncbi:MAG TPA: competence/damage-inducible protein A [Bacteroidia bacterium]|jgi:nicotinamide-nucleotide amidase|nr:competence/damage-inducible protein A [Bacteroidia bacterium]
MLAEIITIGDEILIGQIVDTNSAWMGTVLNESGIKVHQITSVSDNREHILTALREASQRADIILITGGLGPTRDDITKHTLCEYFNTKLRLDESILVDVTNIFKKFGREVTEINRKQAEVPENCIPLHNKTGTAPGMWFDVNGKIYASMPGVPFEMKALMTEEIIPRLKKKFTLPVIIHKNVLTQGIGESALAEKIVDWEDSLAKEEIKLAYLPSPSVVRLRLSINGKDVNILNERIARKVAELQKLVGQFIYGYDDETLEGNIGKLLKEKKQTLSTAESCTGGFIAHKIVSIPGSSDYFKGGIISYANEVKINELEVSKETLDKLGAVSQEVVEQMAIGVRKKLNTDYSIAVSGIAGPDGGTSDKPVGTVWIAIATPTQVFSKKYQFAGNRERNIIVTGLTALNMLRKEILALG